MDASTSSAAISTIEVIEAGDYVSIDSPNGTFAGYVDKIIGPIAVVYIGDGRVSSVPLRHCTMIAQQLRL